MNLSIKSAPSISEIPASAMSGERSVHPAVEAWRKVRSAYPDSPSVDSLQQRPKSALYRLRGAGREGSDVMAKRCFTETALTEQLIYREILPSLPLRGLYCYGCVEDEEPQFHWLFVEDAGNGGYEPDRPDHKAAVARWLAQLHTLAADSPTAKSLPDRGVAYYLAQLRQAQENIVKSYSNPALQGEALEMVKALERQCLFMESCWDRVQDLCEGMPCTLVHGDMKANNLRIRHSSQRTELLLFDWELAGWGVPATDLLKCPDLDLYRAEVCQTWPEFTDKQIRKLVLVGKLFRALITITWNSLKLQFPWVEWSIVKLRIPQIALTEAIQELELK